ncbi:MAG TPA: TadE family protein [Gemmatimonadaceae bacterium]|nr:TadE family protein [Gemmatimonadaceae bacterium]
MKNCGAFFRTLKAMRRSETASAAVELAVILPVLALLAIIASDFARVYFTGITVANAARAGAQYGAQSTATSGDTAGMNLAARQDGANAGVVAVTSRSFCRCDAGEVADCTVGDCGAYGVYRLYVEVTATKAVSMVFRYPGMPTSYSFSRTATLRVQ